MRRDGAKAHDFARRHGVPRWFDDAGALLAQPDLDAIYIATPPASHVDYAIAALAAGKHVYVEKPMARNAEECHALIAAEDAGDGKVSVAHYRRQLPAFIKVGELLRGGHIGTPRWAEIRIIQPPPTGDARATSPPWRLIPAISGGGLFHDLAPHHLDLMLVYFGDPVRWAGLSTCQAGSGDAEDSVWGSMEFAGGVLFHGMWSFATSAFPPEQSCVLTGESGQIRFDFDGTGLTLENQEGTRAFSYPLPEAIQQPMIEQVNAYFRGDAENPCSTRDGLRVMELMDAFTSGVMLPG